MPGRIKTLMLDEYKNYLNEIDDLVILRYSSVSVQETNGLRTVLFDGGNSMMHVRNRIFRKALKDTGKEKLVAFIEGPTAVICGDDVIAGIKAVKEFLRDKKEMEFSGGCFEGEILSSAEVLRLSEIPPRPVLLAQIIAAVNAPVAGVASLLQGLLQKLVLTVKEIEKKK